MHTADLLSGLTTWPLLSTYFLAVVILVYGYRPVQRWRVRHIPGRPPRWFMGNLAELRADGPAKVHQRWAREYGPVFTSFGGSQPFVFTDHPELVRQVLIQHTARPSFPSIWLGSDREFDKASILAIRGEKHRSIRGAWTPMFFSGSLEAYSALMNEATELLLANIALAAKKGCAIDIHKAIGDMTLQVVGTTAFGVDFNTQEDHAARDKPAAAGDSSAQRLKDAVSSIFSVSAMNFSAYTPIMFLFPFTAPLVRVLARAFPDRSLRRMKASREVIVGSVADLISQHREVLAAEEAAAGGQGGQAERAPLWREDTLHVRRGVAPGSFLDLLMRTKDRTTGRGFTDVELAAQAYVMILAGYETTANALGFTLYLLAASPDAQDRLAAEVDAVLGASAHAGYQALERMPYMDACLREGLRLFPPAPTIVREAARDTQIGGHRVRRGQWLGCAVYSMHRNPEYWQDPERFVPERWLEGTPEAAARPAHGWAPFGDGVRACIGTRFALAEAKTTLARLYQRFTFELEPGQVPLEIRNTITISPKHGVHVRAVPRTMQREP